MRGMRVWPAILPVLMLAACSRGGEPVTTPQVDEALIAESPVAAPTDALLSSQPAPSSEYDPGAEFGVFRSEPLLEQMPFGAGMFGGWNVGRQGSAWDDVMSWRRSATPAEPDPNEPIFIDVVYKDLHTFLHYLALQSGLSIIVEGGISGRLIVDFFNHIEEQAEGKSKKEVAIEIIQAICSSNKFDYVRDGDVVIIKQRPLKLAPAHITASNVEGHYDVEFKEFDLVAAIMEVATVTKTQIFVPAVEGSAGARVVTLHMRAALPETILRQLAELGDLDVEQIELESAPGKVNGFKFNYRK
jgi:hypothetical protein